MVISDTSQVVTQAVVIMMSSTICLYLMTFTQEKSEMEKMLILFKQQHWE